MEIVMEKEEVKTAEKESRFEKGIMLEEFRQIRATVKKKAPLIHCITNPIAINDCANAVLALNAQPIMAEHPKEAADITASAGALAVSLANITDARAESIMISGSVGTPSVIDVAGITCSRFRRELAVRFIEKCSPAVVRGNVSEIKAAAGESFCASGVDVGENDAVTGGDAAAQRQMASVVKRYAARINSVVLASGEVDIISDGRRTFLVKNGTADLARVTGTGCMQNCIVGVYLSCADPLSAAVLAAVTLGAAGEMASAENGLGSYHIGLLDALSKLDDGHIAAMMKVEQADV